VQNALMLFYCILHNFGALKINDNGDDLIISAQCICYHHISCVGIYHVHQQLTVVHVLLTVVCCSLASMDHQ